ncbi:MAG: N-acetylmuramic acid 6-phosphate etherase, partial [Actinomycetia bacterium]|nr:N-acetylmuramic acid 6-phosphate etherase [Actinomycetes bacterium]
CTGGAMVIPAVGACYRCGSAAGPSGAPGRSGFGAADSVSAYFPFDSVLPTGTAALVPDVVDAAVTGDTVAGDIIRRAADAWVDTSLAAVRAVDAETIACVGGLAEVPALYDAWAQAIETHVKVGSAVGRSVDGAVMLAERTDLPHEPQVRRASVRTAPELPGENLDVLETEGVREGLDDLDTRPIGAVVDALLDAEGKLASVLDGARDGLVDAVTTVEAALRRGGRLLYVGAGTPGRLAALDAAECPPTFGTPPGLVEAILAGGNDAAASAVEGAEDMSSEAEKALDVRDVGSNDVVVGISASGRTPFVLAAIRRARERGAATIGVVNNADSPIADASDVAVELLTGAEVIGGSTRLTAGTSQKVALNTLSTATMVRLGKTYGPHMVDVVASNHKLRRRASRIVREVSGVDDATATAALEAAGWQAKTAIVALLAGVGTDEARARLGDGDGRVRTAVEGDP